MVANFCMDAHLILWFMQSMVVSNSQRSPEPQTLCLRGVTIPFDDAILTAGILDAMLDGSYEAEESSQIPAIVSPGDRVLEIGAGIGYISTLVSRQPGVRAIVAVEANPLLMDFMARVHLHNSVHNVRRINTVLTNGSEPSAKFYLRQDFWMGSLASEPNSYLDTVEVPASNFNQLLRDERVNLIICDVEGAEADLFEGADLSDVDRIFVELHDHITGMLGIGNLFGTLARHGFVYDPRHSAGSVVLFRKIGIEDLFRPYGA
jgi:FkbM family methyltransferase